MTISPRKVTFQLTPLLDLLLIVIFAQYLDVRETAKSAEDSAAKKESQVAADLKAASQNQAAMQREIDKAKAALQNFQSAQENQRQADADAIKRLQSQRDLLSQHLAALFRLPKDKLEELLKQLKGDDAARTAAEIQKLKDRLDKLQQSQPHQIIRHVVTYEELLKRCDVWEIHIDRQNIANVTVGEKSHEFRYSARDPDLSGDEESDRNERRRYFRDLQKDFEKRLFSFYKSLPQTKNVIIVLMSRGPGTTAATYLAAKQGIQDTADHVSSESGARIQVVNTDLGALRFEPANKP